MAFILIAVLAPLVAILGWVVVRDKPAEVAPYDEPAPTPKPVKPLTSPQFNTSARRAVAGRPSAD